MNTVIRESDILRVEEGKGRNIHRYVEKTRAYSLGLTVYIHFPHSFGIPARSLSFGMGKRVSIAGQSTTT